MLFYHFNDRNPARTSRRFAISRQTFYRWKRRFDRHDLSSLEERSHRPKKVRQPTWSAELAERVLALRKQYPRWGKDKLAVLLDRQHRASTSMVGRILADLKRRGALHEPPKHRMAEPEKALLDWVYLQRQEGLPVVLDELSLNAIDKKKLQKYALKYPNSVRRAVQEMLTVSG
jgi:transposase-like protein